MPRSSESNTSRLRPHHRSSSADDAVVPCADATTTAAATAATAAAAASAAIAASAANAAPLRLRTKCAYGSLKLPMSTFDFLVRLTVRPAVYRDALGMSIGTQAMIVSMCKSADFLIGFAVGKASDSLRSRWGRRKPFIAVCCPLFIIAFLLISNPPAALGAAGSHQTGFHSCSLHPADAADAGSSVSAADAANADVNRVDVGGGGGGCADTRRCIDAAVNASLLPRPFSGSDGSDGEAGGAGVGLSVYFAVLYLTLFVSGWTGTQIPYDALGFELTSDYHQKSALFGIKTAFQFGGYIFQILVSSALAAAHGDDVITRVRLESFVYAAVCTAALMAVLTLVAERKPELIAADSAAASASGGGSGGLTLPLEPMSAPSCAAGEGEAAASSSDSASASLQPSPQPQLQPTLEPMAPQPMPQQSMPPQPMPTPQPLPPQPVPPQPVPQQLMPYPTTTAPLPPPSSATSTAYAPVSTHSPSPPPSPSPPQRPLSVELLDWEHSPLPDTPPRRPPTATPMVVAVRRLFSNRPYVRYLAFRVPMTLAALLPSSVLPDFIKYVMQLEDWSLMLNSALGITLLSILVAIPMLVALSRRYGKREVLVSACVLNGTFAFGCFLVPPQFLSAGLMYALSAVLGLGMAASFVLPDSMLGDVIDYDELISGRRSEGLFTVVETNLQQFVEIVGGVIPAMLAGLGGFRALGGCTCGCGVKCPAEYLRWQCPHDVGYACSAAFDSELLYGDTSRAAPCSQQPEAVQWVFRFFMVGLPALMYLLAAPAAWAMGIGPEQHSAILDGIALSKADPRAPVRDPLTGMLVLRPSDDDGALVAEHFSRAERGCGPARRLRRWLLARLLAWFTCLALLVCTVVWSGFDHAVITLVCFTFAALFLLVPWDAARLHVLCSRRDDWVEHAFRAYDAAREAHALHHYSQPREDPSQPWPRNLAALSPVPEVLAPKVL